MNYLESHLQPLIDRYEELPEEDLEVLQDFATRSYNVAKAVLSRTFYPTIIGAKGSPVQILPVQLPCLGWIVSSLIEVDKHFGGPLDWSGLPVRMAPDRKPAIFAKRGHAVTWAETMGFTVIDQGEARS